MWSWLTRDKKEKPEKMNKKKQILSELYRYSYDMSSVIIIFFFIFVRLFPVNLLILVFRCTLDFEPLHLLLPIPALIPQKKRCYVYIVKWLALS